MSRQQTVIDPTGNHDLIIHRLGRNLATDKLRRKLFTAIYGHVSRPRSKKELMAACGITHEQRADNELRYLYDKNLIDRVENKGQVADGSRYLYLKVPSVKAHKAQILKAADSKAYAEKQFAKRVPNVGAVRMVKRTAVTRQALKKKRPVNILYLMANPSKRHSLRVDKEVADVNEEIRRSNFRDNIILRQSPAANLTAIQRGLNDHRPRIVHFSGHGNTAGIATEGGGDRRIKKEFVDFGLLGKALAATDTPPEVVVLNACQSAGARGALLGSAKAIVVMTESITDRAAIAFAKMFYGGIASGVSLQSAFEQGCVAVQAQSFDEKDVPALYVAKGVNPKRLYLA
jgi:hypothetical protein